MKEKIVNLDDIVSEVESIEAAAGSALNTNIDIRGYFSRWLASQYWHRVTA